MKFIFVGKDGSMGLTKGREYHVKAMAGLFRRHPIVAEITGPSIQTSLTCPYSSFEAFFQNWELVLKK